MFSREKFLNWIFCSLKQAQMLEEYFIEEYTPGIQRHVTDDLVLLKEAIVSHVYMCNSVQDAYLTMSDGLSSAS